MSTPADPGRPVPLLNTANALTAVRIVVVPVFALFVVVSDMRQPGWRVAACVAFCVAAATDYIDGWIARRWNLVTSFGKIADPIADKALIGSGLVLLSVYGHIPVWVTAVILVREFGVTGLRFWIIRRAVIAASRGGKIKTSLQVLAIAWCLAPVPPPLDRVGWWAMMAAMVVTVGTGLDYLMRVLRLRREPAPSAWAGDDEAADPGTPVEPAPLSRGEAA
ncbi:MAG: CDP-diacylglycerol--glycerol-3-phosphate 3-phosphatidyltransferase [Dactylosporangium sp.]|nr:CDP-diacylglycerol--glycerol-3-phosphate 3-phosphatidyltransferase [Dactylosporangium sp.]NNJ61788.1 CDP-diacylglycerol--glycerol-3-phosphate 3-phosphatidyltransferase [Dactylosporangium sp.]